MLLCTPCAPCSGKGQMPFLFTLCLLSLVILTCVCRQHWSNPFLLRGGVFYISMSLWGVQRVETLQISFSSVLPTIREVSNTVQIAVCVRKSSQCVMCLCVQVSQCDHTIVLYEIALSMQRLVRKYAHSLETMDWDSIYVILEAVQSHAHHHFTDQPNHVLVQVLSSLAQFCEVILPFPPLFLLLFTFFTRLS